MRVQATKVETWYWTEIYSVHSTFYDSFLHINIYLLTEPFCKAYLDFFAYYILFH